MELTYLLVWRALVCHQNEEGAAAAEKQAAFVEAWTQEARGHVEDFTDSRFQQDQPTGETPLKKEYPAPEHLVTPPNRAKLAARYRASKLSQMAGPPGTPVQRTAEVGAVGDDAPSPVTRLDAAMVDAAMDGDAAAAEAAPAVVEDDVVLTVDTEAAAAAAADAASTAPPSTRSGRSTPSAASVADDADGDDADGDDAASEGAAQRAGRSRIPTAGGASRTRGRSTRRKKAAADAPAPAKSRSRSRHARTASSEDAPVAKAKPATRRSSRRRAAGKALGDATNVA